VVDREKLGVNSRDEGKHTRRNDLFICNRSRCGLLLHVSPT